MAQKKITDLTLRSDFDETCNVPVQDAVQSWRTTGAQFKAFIKNNLIPFLALGDLLTADADGDPVVLSGNTTATKKFLSQTGDGSGSATPAWSTLGPTDGAVPTGVILPYMGTSAPSGYLICDGATVSRTTYAALFAAISTSCGAGDGTTTFHLPDLRGRFLRGWANGSANDPDRASRTAMNSGGATGDNVGSVQADMFKSHTHGIPQNGGGSGQPTLDMPIRNPYYGPQTDAAGGSETRPKNAYVNYIIKT